MEPEPLTISVDVAAQREEDDAEALTARAAARLLSAKAVRDDVAPLPEDAVLRDDVREQSAEPADVLAEIRAPA